MQTDALAHLDEAEDALREEGLDHIADDVSDLADHVEGGAEIDSVDRAPHPGLDSDPLAIPLTRSEIRTLSRGGLTEIVLERDVIARRPVVALFPGGDY